MYDLHESRGIFLDIVISVPARGLPLLCATSQIGRGLPALPEYISKGARQLRTNLNLWKYPQLV